MQLYETNKDAENARWHGIARRPWLFLGVFFGCVLLLGPLEKSLGGWSEWAALGVALAVAVPLAEWGHGRRSSYAVVMKAADAGALVGQIGRPSDVAVTGVLVSTRSPRVASAFSRHLLSFMEETPDYSTGHFVGGPQRTDRLVSTEDFVTQFGSPERRPIIAFYELLNGEELWAAPKGRRTLMLLTQGDRASTVARAIVNNFDEADWTL